MFNTGNDLKENVKSDSMLLTSGKSDLKKQRSVTQATQTSPEVPWPSHSVNVPKGSFDITKEQVKGNFDSSMFSTVKKKVIRC